MPPPVHIPKRGVSIGLRWFISAGREAWGPLCLRPRGALASDDGCSFQRERGRWVPRCYAHGGSLASDTGCSSQRELRLGDGGVVGLVATPTGGVSIG